MRKKIIAFFLSVCLILVFSSTALAYNTKELEKAFTHKNSGDWVYQLLFDSTDTACSMTFAISNLMGQEYFVMYGFVYDFSRIRFEKLNGYKITIDGHTYDISSCVFNFTQGTSVGSVECPVAIHPLLHNMLKEMRNAKNEIKISYKCAYGSSEIVMEVKLNLSDFYMIKNMADAVCNSGFLDSTFGYMDYSTVTEYY